MMDNDQFTPRFKKLKARNPPPDFSDVLDFRSAHPEQFENVMRHVISDIPLSPPRGMKRCSEWNAFKFTDHPGFFFIQNPFLDGYQRYWVIRCLQDFPSNPDNVTNLKALGSISSEGLWEEFVRSKSNNLYKQDPLRKLRWTTLGYHYDWNVKKYSEDCKTEFPVDVQCLSKYLAAALGFDQYKAEAAIINYYHLDSTLAGHTDHSELDHTAPLFSISFGQTAVFMIGGEDKSVKPTGIFLHSGDICVMSGTSRLAYHAVPKILPSHHKNQLPSCFDLQNIVPPSDSVTTKGGEQEEEITRKKSDSLKIQGEIDCIFSSQSADGTTVNDVNTVQDSTLEFNDYDSCVEKVDNCIDTTLSNIDWEPFAVYLSSSRINMNIRQVLPPGYSALPDIKGTTNTGLMGMEVEFTGAAENCAVFDTNNVGVKKAKRDDS